MSIRVAVTTTSPEAQQWFDRGLVWCYAYFHDEAVACFRNALSADPGCAMAHWGVAYATGPNYNMPWELSGREHAARLARGGLRRHAGGACSGRDGQSAASAR